MNEEKLKEALFEVSKRRCSISCRDKNAPIILDAVEQIMKWHREECQNLK